MRNYLVHKLPPFCDGCWRSKLLDRSINCSLEPNIATGSSQAFAAVVGVSESRENRFPRDNALARSEELLVSLGRALYTSGADDLHDHE